MFAYVILIYYLCSMKKIIGIYKITNPKGKVYIGQSTNIEKRFRLYKGLHCARQIKLFSSLKKYGYVNHIFEIVEECLIDELNEKEIYYINLFQSFNTHKGLNLQGGGSNGIKSDETKKRMSVAKKGRIVSQETREKLRQANLGKTISPEYRKKLSDANKGKTHTHTEETKRKISESKKGKPSHRKGVKLSDETKLKMSLAKKNKQLWAGIKCETISADLK